MAYQHPFPYPVAAPVQEPLLQQAMQLPPQAAAAAAAGGPFHVAYTSGYTSSSFANATPRGPPPTGAYPGFYPGAGGGGGAPYGAPPFSVAGSGPGPGSVSNYGGSGVAPPGTAAYFTTPHQGSIYADPYTEQTRQQQMQQAQQQTHQTMQQQQAQADGRLYNGWVGLPDDGNNRDENEDDRNRKDKKHKSRSKTASSDKKKDKKDKRTERQASSKNCGQDRAPANTFPVLSPTVNDSKKQRRCRHQRRQDDGACDSKDEDDRSDLSSFYGSDSDSSLSRAGNARSRARRTRPAPVCDVPLHLGGSGRIVVHCVGGAQPDMDNHSHSRAHPRRRRHRHRLRRHRQHDGADSDTDADTDTALSPLSVPASLSPPTTSQAAADDAAAVPAVTSFAVSARRMRQTAKNWTRFCRPGTDACETTVDDPAAVLGMYRMLEVLHTGVPPGQAAMAAAAAERSMREHAATSSSSSPPHSPSPLSASPSSPFPRDPFQPLLPTPVVLPPRVLAYVVLFGLEFGTLEPAAGTASMSDDGKSRQQKPHTAPSLLLMPAPASVSASASAPHQPPPPLPNLLRARTTAWLDAFAYSVGSHSDNNSSSPAAETAAPLPRSDRSSPLARDWPYVLYVARVLGHRALFGACVRLLLEQWGPLVEAGEAGALLAGLPSAMQTTVQRDMGCLRAARMRSVESIVNAAMHTFPPPSL